MWVDRRHARIYIKGIVLALGLAALLFVPLGIYFVFHPDQFVSHSVEVSVFSPTATEKNVGAAIAENASRVGKMFFIEGDSGLIRNVPRRPVFDPLTAALFGVGVIVWLLALLPCGADTERLNQKRVVFVLVWLGVALAVSLFSDDAPNFGRLLHAAPAIMLLGGWGAMAIWQRLQTPVMRRAGVMAITAILVVSGGLAFRDYFLIFGTSPALVLCV